MTQNDKYKILFVCLGNICRSPIAHGYFQKLVDDAGLGHAFEIDSAGTSGFHRGSPPDPGSRKICSEMGISIDHQKSRKVVQRDIEYYDLIVAMDQSNLYDLQSMANGNHTKLVKMRDYDEQKQGGDVPDPYGGGYNGFQEVYDIVVRSSEKLFIEIKTKL